MLRRHQERIPEDAGVELGEICLKEEDPRNLFERRRLRV